MNTALRFQGVGKAFAGRAVLPPLNLVLEHGDFLVVTGPSGIGKSTLLRIAAGLERPSRGRVVRNARRVGFVFQEHRLLPWCTALQNVILPQQAVGIGDGEAGERATELLGEMGLGDFLSAYPGRMSGGMRQRVALARAFAVRPDLLLLDEPFTGLDVALRLELRRKLEGFLASSGAATILVTHDLQDIPTTAGRFLDLSPDGTVSRPEEAVTA